MDPNWKGEVLSEQHRSSSKAARKQCAKPWIIRFVHAGSRAQKCRAIGQSRFQSVHGSAVCEAFNRSFDLEMSHHRNRRAFAARTARGFMRLNKFSSADKPAPEGLASAGTTGSAEGSTSAADAMPKAGSSPEQRGAHEVTSKPDQQRPTPLSDHSAGGGVLVAMPFLILAAFDRYATLMVVVATLVLFAWAVVRANRSPRPTTPPRGPFAGSDPRNNRS